MEDLIHINILNKHENVLVPNIFTKIQFNTLKKKIQKKELTKNEKTYYYTYIKPKIKAILSLLNISEYKFQGKEYITDKRVIEGTNVLNKIIQKHKHQKIMISGSFLFNKKYDDVDIFIFSKYKKEDYKKGKLHITFLPEESIHSLFFRSISKISISNFEFELNTEYNIQLQDILQKYELIINYIIQNEDYKNELRHFLLEMEYFSKEVILNPKELYNLTKKLNRNNYELISNILINSLIIHNTQEIKEILYDRIKDYTQLLKEYPKSKNLKEYITTYNKVITFGIQPSKNTNKQDFRKRNIL